MTTATHSPASIKENAAAKPPAMPIIAENIPTTLQRLPRWLGWRWTWKKADGGTGKWTKPPIDIRRDRLGSSTDSASWCDFATALRAAESAFVDGIGFALGDGFCGVDFDNCRDRETGEISPIVGALIKRINSYGEVSPSGEGVKLIVQGTLPQGRRANGNLEMYDRGRYFTITGHKLDGCPLEPAPRDDVLAAIHAEFISSPEHSATTRQEAGIDDRELALSALAGLAPARADSYHDWLAVGMALHAVSDDLLSAWDSWSQSSAKYSAGDCAAKWVSFGRGSNLVGIGTLIHWAKQDGWTPPRRNASRKKRKAWQAYAAQPNSDGFYPCTDLGNAERLRDAYGHAIRYVGTWDKFLAWDGTRWTLDSTRQIERWAKRTVRKICDEAARAANTDRPSVDADELWEWAKASESRAKIKSMVELLASEERIAIDHEVLDTDPWKLNCSNGTVNLRTGELLPHDPADLITKSTGVEYPTEAGDDPVLWLDTLSTILGERDDLLRFVQKLLGLALVGTVYEHLLPILWGCGANGKSVFIETAMAAMGDYAMKAPRGMLLAKRNESHPTELADLCGRRLVAVVETSEGRSFDESLVKEITGGDTVRARRMKEDFWEFKPAHTPFLVTNHKPIVRGTDNGIWRRLRLIPFTVTIPPEQQDKRLAEKLRGELPQILRWMVAGCLLWQREGLQEPDIVLAATSQYKADSDILGQWLDERCEFDSGYEQRASDLWASYKVWCETNEERKLGSKAFYQRMGERFTVRRSNGIWYEGLRLRPLGAS